MNVSFLGFHLPFLLFCCENKLSPRTLFFLIPNPQSLLNSLDIVWFVTKLREGRGKKGRKEEGRRRESLLYFVRLIRKLKSENLICYFSFFNLNLPAQLSLCFQFNFFSELRENFL